MHVKIKSFEFSNGGSVEFDVGIRIKFLIFIGL